MNEEKPNEVIWLFARIYGTIVIIITLYLFLEEYFEELQNPKASVSSAFSSFVDGMLCEWVLFCIAFTGLILAYWKGGIGGGISLIFFILFFAFLESGNLLSVSSIILVFLSLSSVL